MDNKMHLIEQRRAESQETQAKARELLHISQAVEATHPEPNEMTDDQLDELIESVEGEDNPRPVGEHGTLMLMLMQDLRRIEDKFDERLDRLERRKLPLAEGEKVELRKAMGNLRMSWPKSGETVHKFLVRAYGDY